MKYLFLLSYLILFVSPAWGYTSDQRDKGYSWKVQGYGYKDVNVGGGVTVDLSSTVGFEYNMRMYNSFNFIIDAHMAPDGTRQGYGFGFRIDTPGFFFYGADREDLFRSSKAYPWNTSLFVKTLFTIISNEGAPDTQTVVSHYGGAIDSFIYNQTFLSLEFSIYTLKGNTALGGGLGIGYEY